MHTWLTPGCPHTSQNTLWGALGVTLETPHGNTAGLSLPGDSRQKAEGKGHKVLPKARLKTSCSGLHWSHSTSHKLLCEDSFQGCTSCLIFFSQASLFVQAWARMRYENPELGKPGTIPGDLQIQRKSPWGANSTGELLCHGFRASSGSKGFRTELRTAASCSENPCLVSSQHFSNSAASIPKTSRSVLAGRG